jgi:ABC-type uncharacterized transport system substrate-binding protein
MDSFVLRKGAVLLVAMAFAGCTTVQPVPEPVTDEPVVVVTEPSPVPVEPPVTVKPPPPLPSVAIVLTNSRPAYADVAQELSARFDDYEIYDLSKDSRPPVSILGLINDASPTAVIAIGLRAAQSSIAMSKQPVIFSQVFNHEHHKLLKENSRGIAVLPPLDAQIAAWKEFDPTISRIGMIIGEGHDDLITDAEVAAQRHDVELIVQVTRSDQETLYFFRRMIRDIDGFWLFPDNRILSTRVLQQMLEDANRQRVPVNVPSDAMLSLGAMISMTSQASDIADTIVKVVRMIQAGKLDRVPPITQLSEIRVKTNNTSSMVQR